MRAGRGRASYRPAVQPSPAQRRGDLAVVGYAVAAQVEMHVWHPDAGLVPRLVLLLAVLCLLARSRWPRAVPLLSAGAGGVVGALPVGEHTGFSIVLVGVAAALLGRQGRPALPSLALLVAFVIGSGTVDLVQRSDLVTAPLVVLVTAGASAGLYRARRQVEEVRARIDALTATGDDHTTLLGAERRRVARELHDVVSHHLTVAALQAGGARVQLAAAGPTAAVTDALRASEDAGRRALAELRSLLDVVGAEPGRAPQPGLADAPELVRRIRAAGVLVRHTGVDLAELSLPAGHDLVAYRVLQEALTNAVRHGRPVVDVRVDVDDGHLRLEVANDVGARRKEGGGHGLVGLRERLALYGGSLDAGIRGGRWTLRAELPLPQAVPA